ncbi:LolA family protein [Cobetia marina]|uniref:LolA family protein n=1 Tax=Cobetia marina TaxID=28258 RepID=UPI0011419ED7|nr:MULTISPECIES: LolA-related protein [Cobetia]MDI6002870.1 hypothetical protein [Cobetia pacifica]GED44147.1 outer-membrane lipoprotein carrier protein [Cobetia marina]
MTSRLAIAATALLLTASAFGASAAEFDARALTQQLARTAPVCGDFQQTRWLEDVGAQLKSRGQFHLIGDPNAPEGLVWDTTSPIEDRLEMRPNASEGPDGEPLPADQQAMAELLVNFFHGDWQALEEHFTLQLTGSADDWQASLIPRDARLAEAIEHLEIEGGSWLDHLTLTSGDGDRLALTLTPRDQCPE